MTAGLDKLYRVWPVQAFRTTRSPSLCSIGYSLCWQQEKTTGPASTVVINSSVLFPECFNYRT